MAEVPVPVGEKRRALVRGGATGVRKRSGRPVARREKPAGFGSVALEPCPLCKSEVVEQEKAYACCGRTRGCRFTIGKTIAGKRIGVRAAQALLREGRSPLLKGFKSKYGRPFEARLELDGGEVRFDFGP